MQLLYNISIFIYRLFIGFASLFNKKAKLWVEGRKNIFKQIEVCQLLPANRQLIWFHCASLGEFEQGRPIIEKFKVQGSRFKVVLTFFSPSGYEVRKNYAGADYIFYLPLDTPANARKFIEIVKPQAVFFIKYEFWFNYLSELKKRNIPTHLISGIFRKEQHFFKWYGSFFRNKLSCFTHFFLQDNNSEKLLHSIGIKNTIVSGDTRFDRVYNISQTAKPIPLIEIFKQNKKLIVAGSTWGEDEELLLKYVNRAKNQESRIKIVIVPHEIDLQHVNGILKLFSQSKVILYSQANEKNVIDVDILIIDNIGMLSSLYQYATVAYIGGGFDKGIHNILEPATFGSPVIFGPEFEKFNEAKELLSLGGAYAIDNYDSFEMVLDKLLSDKEALSKASAVCKNYVAQKKGATDIIMEKVLLSF